MGKVKGLDCPRFINFGAFGVLVSHVTLVIVNLNVNRALNLTKDFEVFTLKKRMSKSLTS